MPMNELREVKNTSLSFPLKHVGTTTHKATYRDLSALKEAIKGFDLNKATNDWRISGLTITHEMHNEYVAIKVLNPTVWSFNPCVSEENLPIIRLTREDLENPSMVYIDELCLQTLTLIEGESRKVKHLQIRNNRCKITKLLNFIAEWANEFFAERKKQEVYVSESNVKRYIESMKSKTYYTYAVDSLDQMDTATFSKVVGLIYGLHERTNTTSCMVKGNSDRLGADYYDGFLHPFHCYRTRAWKLLLVSDKTPEQVEQVDFAGEEVKSPFLARAWATTCGTGVYYTYRFYGARDAVDAIHTDKEIVLIHYNPTDAPLRLYKDTSGDYVCAYIDGHNYVGVDSYVEYEDKDGNIYITGFACYKGACYADIYEPQHSTGLTEQLGKYVYCEIYEDEYPEDECEYSQEIGGYVHRVFWNYTNNTLDGYAIYRYYR